MNQYAIIYDTRFTLNSQQVTMIAEQRPPDNEIRKALAMAGVDVARIKNIRVVEIHPGDNIAFHLYECGCSQPLSSTTPSHASKNWQSPIIGREDMRLIQMGELFAKLPIEIRKPGTRLRGGRDQVNEKGTLS